MQRTQYSTDHDYAHMVNPFVRAEREAHEKGKAEGYRLALYHFGCFIVALLIAFSISSGAA
jgi:hypothetical protein